MPPWYAVELGPETPWGWYSQVRATPRLAHDPKATERIDAGPVTIGVEYRHVQAGRQSEHGVSLHVFEDVDGAPLEHLRFDLFAGGPHGDGSPYGPHYHYLNWGRKRQLVFPMDEIANGDLLEWSFRCLETRMPQMLRVGGSHELALRVERRAAEISRAMPKVRAAVKRALRDSRQSERDQV